MTVLQVIQKSAEFLARKGVESPRLQVELMLCEVLTLPRVGLYMNFERELPAEQLDQLRDWVRRRAEREPLQHILGTANFCGYEVEVNRHVLIPRPETELLAERGWNFLKERVQQGISAGNGSMEAKALDIGTGSGCIAIALAAKCPQAQITAVDISREAAEVASRNIQRHGLSQRIRLVEGSFFSPLKTGEKFDLIISNPPYIASGEIPALDPEVRLHDPLRALDGGEDGLDCYRSLAKEAAAFLNEGGRLMMEFGDGQEKAIEEILLEQKWIVEAIVPDYNRKPRFVVALR